MVITPLAGALILEILSKFDVDDHVKDTITLISLALPVILLFTFASAYLEEPIIYELGGWSRPYGITLVLDSFSAVMAFIVGAVTLSSFVYSLEVKSLLPKGDKYYFLFLFMTTGLYGVFLTGDIINRYIFFELTVLTSYVLLTYTGDKNAIRASFNYLVIGSIASFFFLVGIGLLYFYTGFLDFKALSGSVISLSTGTRDVIFLFFLVAVGIKAGLIPFHTWLPDAHVSAPTPMTAVLAGVTVKTGAYIIFKLFSIGFTTPFIRGSLLFIASLTAFFGAFMSLKYYDIKKILAWLTISQMGLITIAISFWTTMSVASALMHIVNHSLFKTLLFLSMGALVYLHGERDIRRLDVMKSNNLTSMAFIIGVLSIIGIPPFNGFYSKSLILSESRANPFIFITILIVQALTAASIVRVFTSSRSSKLSGEDHVENDKNKKNKRLNESILVPLVVLAGLCVFIGVTSSIWMENILVPSTYYITGVDVSGFIVPSLLDVLFTMEGALILLSSGVGILLSYKISKLDLSYMDGIISKVSVTDSVRWIIFAITIYIALSLLV
ncbi:MAG: complex I subunit 5 family protein [Thermoplasmatota archaeon]